MGTKSAGSFRWGDAKNAMHYWAERIQRTAWTAASGFDHHGRTMVSELIIAQPAGSDNAAAVQK